MTTPADLDPMRQADVDHGDLVGQDCPACGSTIEPGAIRWNGSYWAHKDPNSHPQAGHHVFDAVEAAGGDDGDN